MDTNIIIAIAVISTLGFGIIIHSWLHKIIKFKIDESAIVQHFCENKISHAIPLHTIAKAVTISEKRTLEVCHKSLLLISHANDHWSLKD